MLRKQRGTDSTGVMRDAFRGTREKYKGWQIDFGFEQNILRCSCGRSTGRAKADGTRGKRAT